MECLFVEGLGFSDREYLSSNSLSSNQKFVESKRSNTFAMLWVHKLGRCLVDWNTSVFIGIAHYWHVFYKIKIVLVQIKGSTKGHINI